ncbi:MAG: helix-turn-helix domain-containing protein [Pleurocapsa minor GSE-CHR-MK-17-07R]|jgi:AcrR family transcriptional regulator|nr:helix-turn-helix domain-containing protein [Pleurocapsa minor GSE-CHR-MK 17-07R]
MTEVEQRQAGEFQPAEQFVIGTLEQLKVFADPLRQQITETLCTAPKTVKQVAKELGLAPTKLYYHFNLLEENGFLVVTDTRIVSGIIEKQYRTAALQFSVSRALLNPALNDGYGLATLLDSILGGSQSEIISGVQDGIIQMTEDAATHTRMRLWRTLSSMTPEEATEFYGRLNALITEFGESMEDRDLGKALPNEGAYRLVAAIYPIRMNLHVADDADDE